MRPQAHRSLIAGASRAVALALALAACGNPPPPAAPAASSPPADAPPPPPDPAMAEVLVELRAQRARMCACTDAACVENAEVASFEWSFAHKELIDRTKPTPAQETEATELIHATEECAERFPH